MQLTMFMGSEPKRIGKPVRLIELFAGYGSQAFALEYLGVNFESWRICEWAVKSIQAYKDAHCAEDCTDYSEGLTDEEVLDYLTVKGISADYNKPMTREQIKRFGAQKQRQIYNNIIATHNLVNIQQVRAADLGITETDKYEYVMTYSFPCETADSLILTKDGYKEFCELHVGEYVLTKSNTWQRIAKIFDNGVHDTYYLQGMGFENIHCTANHKFYVREKYRKGHKNIRCFREPIFKETKDLTKNDYFGVPIIQEENPFYTDDLEFWYMIGYYLGDGWLASRGNDVVLACNDTKLLKLKARLSQDRWHWTYCWNGTCYRLRFSNSDIYSFIKNYIGTGSFEKRICGEILRLPKEQLQALLDGYIDSDGSRIGKNIQFSSVNRGLIYGISAIINKLYHRTTCITKNRVSPKKIIQGRVVSQHDWYLLRFKIQNDVQDKAFYENGYLWFPFTRLSKANKEHVYNMEVENDHSYIIQGCISKNCQDLSKAGLGKGMEKGSGTRSGMLWEVERILDECEELPQVLLMENVPDVIGVNNIKHFADWLAKLESLGYHCYWQVLNGKDFGVPQNRERCFMVSLLGDYYYAFPEAIKLEKRLKDLLEDEVDEKYYLSDKIVNYYENHSKEAEKKGNGFRFNPFVKTDVVAKTITTRAGSRMDDNFIEEPKVLAGIGEKKSNGGTQWYQQDRIYDDNIAISVTTSFNPWYATEKKENLKTQLCNDLVESGLLEENYVINHSYTNGGNCKNRNSRQSLEDYIETTDNMMPTLTTRVDCLGVVVNSNNKRLKSLVDKMDLTKDNQFMDVYNQTTSEDASNSTAVYTNYRIRKLTPKECFRLMGVKDKDFERIAKNQSNMSLYHLAGDSIIVDVLMAIFRNMIEE